MFKIKLKFDGFSSSDFFRAYVTAFHQFRSSECLASLFDTVLSWSLLRSTMLRLTKNNLQKVLPTKNHHNILYSIRTFKDTKTLSINNKFLGDQDLLKPKQKLRKNVLLKDENDKPKLELYTLGNFVCFLILNF